MSITHGDNPESDMSDADEPRAIGWHTDGKDSMVNRYWTGQEWTEVRRWNGTEWAPAPVEPTPAPPTEIRDSATASTGDLIAPVSAALSESSRTFKVFVGAAFATVVGYFVPVGTVTTEYGYSETRDLGDAGGFGVLVLAAAVATMWLAWPSRQGVVSKGGLWGIAAMAGITGLFTIGLVSGLGTTTQEQDVLFTTVTQTQSVTPSLGLFCLLGAVVTQGVGIYLAINDRRRG